MNDCINAEVRDALPDLLHGRLSDLDRSTMKAHVESCADCRAELALMERIRAYAPVAPSIDVSRVVSLLPAPLPPAEQPSLAMVAAQRSPISMVLKLAAAAALVVAGALTLSNARSTASPGASVAIAPAPTSGEVAAPSVQTSPVPTQVAIATPAISTPVKHVAAPAAAGLSLTGGVQDLTDAQLEALLKAVDSVDGLPAAEPEAISVSVDGSEGLQ